MTACYEPSLYIHTAPGWHSLKETLATHRIHGVKVPTKLLEVVHSYLTHMGKIPKEDSALPIHPSDKAYKAHQNLVKAMKYFYIRPDSPLGNYSMPRITKLIERATLEEALTASKSKVPQRLIHIIEAYLIEMKKASREEKLSASFKASLACQNIREAMTFYHIKPNSSSGHYTTLQLFDLIRRSANISNFRAKL